MENITQTEKEIFNIFKDLVSKYKSEIGRISLLTKRLHSLINLYGENSGNVIRNSFHNNEWLYDIVWVKVENNLIVNTELVLESELSSNRESDLAYDFDKLLLAKAENKIFICRNEGNLDFRKNLNRRIEFLKNRFDAYQVNNGEILLLVWDDYYTNEVFAYKLIKNGNNKTTK